MTTTHIGFDHDWIMLRDEGDECDCEDKLDKMGEDNRIKFHRCGNKYIVTRWVCNCGAQKIVTYPIEVKDSHLPY